MDEDEEDRLDDTTSFGLHRVLQQAGVDLSTFTSVYGNSGQGVSQVNANALADADISDAEDKYEDDASLADSDDETRIREQLERKRISDEQRWMKKAMQMEKEIKTRVKVVKDDPLMKVRKVWPEWEKGQRLKMTEVFYDTPLMQMQRDRQSLQSKRRKLEHVDYTDCELYLSRAWSSVG